MRLSLGGAHPAKSARNTMLNISAKVQQSPRLIELAWLVHDFCLARLTGSVAHQIHKDYWMLCLGSVKLIEEIMVVTGII